MKKFLTSLLFLLLACGTVSAADITTALLTSGNDTTDLTDYTTASIAPTGNNLILATVQSRITGATPLAPTLTGNGLTWVEVVSQTYQTNASPDRRITIFRALGASPSSGTVAISFGAVTQADASWIISEFTNVDTGGSDGADAVVQSVAGTSTDAQTSFLVTLAAFGNINNATFGAIGVNVNGTTAQGTGFTEIADVNVVGSLETQWRNDNDTSVDWTHNSADSVGLAVEIKNAFQTVHETKLVHAIDTTDRTVYTTASVSPTANNLLLLWVGSLNADTGAASPEPTVVGNGVTWVKVGTQSFDTNNKQRGTLFRAMGGSPSSGTIAITFSENQNWIGWILSEFANVDTGGSNGADAVVQSVLGTDTSATSLLITLAAFGNVNNATYGGIAHGALTTPGSGFIEIADNGGGGQSQWKSDNDTSVDWSGWTARDVGGVAIEIKNVVQASTGATAGARGARTGFTF